jgi:hypothetical protein
VDVGPSHIFVGGSFNDVIGSPAWTVAATVLAAVAIGVSVYLSRRGRSRKELTYAKQVTQLVSIHDEGLGRISIHYEDEPVERAYLIELSLRNSGNVPIVEDDFDRPFTVTFGRATPMTLDIGETKPPELNPSLEMDENSVSIQPLLLNPGDELTFKVLVRDFDGEATLHGRIVGVRELVDARLQAERAASWRRAFAATPITSWLAALFSVVLVVLALVSSLNRDEPTEKADSHTLFHVESGPQGSDAICGDLRGVDGDDVEILLPSGGYTVVGDEELGKVAANAC